MGNTSASTRKGPTDVETGALTSGSDSSSSSSPEPLPEWMKVLHRVPPRLREKKKHLYDPSVVSLGPFHHGRPHLLHLEEFKDKLVAVMLGEEDRRLLLRSRILERIDDVRHFYGDISREVHDDEALASMMLRDACLLLYCMELSAAEEEEVADEEAAAEKGMLLLRYLGMFQATLMASDCLKLENQINDDGGGGRRELIRRFLSLYTYGNAAQMEHLGLEEADEDDQPLHLLEALRNAILFNSDDSNMEESIISALEEFDSTNCESTADRPAAPPCPAACSGWAWRRGRTEVLQPPFRTVREMKARGVYIRRSSSSFLLDQLHVVLLVRRAPPPRDGGPKGYGGHLLQHGGAGDVPWDAVVTSYLMLMKSMLEGAEDVKELQEKGVIVRMLKDMEFRVDMLPVFDDIKMRINLHCSSKAKTWLAELMNTNFRSLWAATALAAAGLLFCLTFLQTYFTINPRT